MNFRLKILGAIIYSMGFLGLAFIITETDIDFADSFIGILASFGWLCITMITGTILMKSGNKSDDDK